MNPPTRTIPIAAVVIVAAFSGALASAVVERAAVAASAPLVQTDPRLTTLLKYVVVDEAGNVTIKGGKINLQGSGDVYIQGNDVKIGAAASATLEGGSNVFVTGRGATAIKGNTVTICCPAR